MKNRIKAILITLVSVSALISCSSTNEKHVVKSNFPPGVCKIVGEIVSINKDKLSDNKNSPCSKQPCWAEVKIVSIEGCGAGGPIVGKKDTLTINFAFTLGKTTKEFFPNLDERLPGLEIGSQFSALLSKLTKLNFSSDKREDLYKVYTYKKVSQ